MIFYSFTFTTNVLKTDSYNFDVFLTSQDAFEMLMNKKIMFVAVLYKFNKTTVKLKKCRRTLF